MSKTICISHNADLDGFCSRAIAERHFGDKAIHIGWNYGDPIPDLSEYDKVYLMDISFPKKDMDAIAHKSVWLDHHQSSIAENNPTIRGVRIDGIAACRLTWQFFNGNHTATKADYLDHKVKEPYGVRLLGEYDVWNKADENTDPFQVGLQAEKTPDWGSIFADNRSYVDEIVKNGEVIQRYLKVTNADIAQHRGFDFQWEGFKWRVLNNARSNSLTFVDALDESHDGCLSYGWTGKVWKVSLYGVDHKKGLDLSVVAKKYGGGGHRQAAGCELTTEQLPKELGGHAASS